MRNVGRLANAKPNRKVGSHAIPRPLHSKANATKNADNAFDYIAAGLQLRNVKIIIPRLWSE